MNWMGLLLNWRTWAVLALAGALGAAWIEHRSAVKWEGRYEAEKAAGAAFRAQVAAAGEQATKKAKETEAGYAKQVKTAVAARDDALKRLRESANRPIGGFVPPDTRPASAGGICYDPSALDAAIRQFATGVQGIVAQGDAASLDAQALIQAWPR
jgi:hypothetical protein